MRTPVTGTAGVCASGGDASRRGGAVHATWWSIGSRPDGQRAVAAIFFQPKAPPRQAHVTRRTYESTLHAAPPSPLCALQTSVSQSARSSLRSSCRASGSVRRSWTACTPSRRRCWQRCQQTRRTSWQSRNRSPRMHFPARHAHRERDRALFRGLRWAGTYRRARTAGGTRRRGGEPGPRHPRAAPVRASGAGASV